MVEFIGAFLGAFAGVVGIYLFAYKKVVEELKKQYDADIRIKFHED